MNRKTTLYFCYPTAVSRFSVLRLRQIVAINACDRNCHIIPPFIVEQKVYRILLLIFFSRSKYNFGVSSEDSDSEQSASTAARRITRSPSVASSASAATVGRCTTSAPTDPDLQLTPPNQVNPPVVSDLTESDQNVSERFSGLKWLNTKSTFIAAVESIFFAFRMGGQMMLNFFSYSWDLCLPCFRA